MMWKTGSTNLIVVVCATIIFNSGDTIFVRGRVDNHNNKRERIRVPLGRRLADVITRHSNPTTAPRRFEIEADDGTSNGAMLMVEEVQQMAITTKTTFSFHKSREFSADKLKDISILASNPEEVDGITIMSIDKSTGDVRGLRRGRTGHTHKISVDHNDDDGRKLRLTRSLDDGEIPAKNWTCGAAHAHNDDDDTTHHHHHHHHRMLSETNEVYQQDFVPGEDSNSNLKSLIDTTSGGKWMEPTKYSFHVDLSIDIDNHFIERQGGAEAAVE